MDPYTAGTEDIPERIFREAASGVYRERASAVVLCILLLLGGVVCLFWPEAVWALRHWWSVDGGEPSDLYLRVTRVFGALMLAGAAALLVWMLFIS